MFAQLERTQSNAYQNKNKHRTLNKQWEVLTQYINNNKTATLERTAASATGGKGLNAIHLHQIFALDSVVVKTQNGVARMDAYLLMHETIESY